MRFPFCEQCVIVDRCERDTAAFLEETGNVHVPSEDYCKKQYLLHNEEIGEFYKNVLVSSVNNPTSLYAVFPELKDQMKIVENEWRELHPVPEGEKDPWEFMFNNKLPLTVTLMLTEECNLACEYCYERFSGNVKPRTMSREIVDAAIDKYMSPESLKLHDTVQWDLIGGEVFVQFDLLQYTVDRILTKARSEGLCPRKLSVSLCTNGTHFHRPEVRDWLLKVQSSIGGFGVGLSLDGIKECHDLCRNKSHDRVMEYFDWWKTSFNDSGIKGTISPNTLKYLYKNVRFYIEDCKLDKFFINPTFEGPWTDEDAILYGDELVKCAEYFLDHPEIRVFDSKVSNLFSAVQYNFDNQPRKQNWCGSGTYMRAVDVDGRIFPCLRAITSNQCPIGTLVDGVDRNKLVPFYLYTHYNDDTECLTCKTANYCPSCVMQWVEDTGDMFIRSKKLCTMTKVKHRVSQWVYDQLSDEDKAYYEASR